MKNKLDHFIEVAKIDAPPAELEETDIPDPNPQARTPPTSLSCEDAEITNVIWATGFKGRFDWLHCSDFDEDGMPVHEGGVSPQPGLYFCGFPWLSKRKSGLIYGVVEDGPRIAGLIAS